MNTNAAAAGGCIAALTSSKSLCSGKFRPDHGIERAVLAGLVAITAGASIRPQPLASHRDWRCEAALLVVALDRRT